METWMCTKEQTTPEMINVQVKIKYYFSHFKFPEKTI